MPTDQVPTYYKMSLPLYEDSLSFDEFLFVFELCENQGRDIDDQFEMGKGVDNRLVDFLKYD